MRQMILFTLALSSFTLAASPCPVRFDGQPHYLFGASAEVEDFNHDGLVDVLSWWEEPGFRVNLQRPGASFGPGPLVEIGATMAGQGVADWNHDTHPDVMVTDSMGRVQLFPGTGDGGFEASRIAAQLDSPLALTAGDFDADGRRDVAVGDGDAVEILWGAGDGTFPARTTLPFDGFAFFLDSGDVNHDGRDDLVVARDMGPMELYLGTEGRTFASPRRVSVAGGTYGVRVVDVDGDGHLDIGSADQFAFVVSVSRGRGDGTFRNREDYPAGSATQGIEFGDIDGDGYTDALTGNIDSHGFVILYGRSDGTLEPPVLVDAGSWVAMLFARDLDGDGRDDVIAGDWAGFTVLVQDPEGEFVTPPSVTLRDMPTDSATADFDRDGRPDLVVSTGSSVEVLLSDGAGSLGASRRISLDGEPQAVAAGDFDRDGDGDVAWAGAAGLAVQKGRGDGAFDSPKTITLDSPAVDLTAADWDGDGDLDLVVSEPLPGYVRLMRNSGSGTFSLAGQVAGRAPAGTALADVNSDGKLDMIVIDNQEAGGAGPGLLVVHHGSGGTSFPKTTEIALGLRPADVKAADFDADGDIDIAVAHLYDDDVWIFSGNGAGAFTRTDLLPMYVSVPRIAAADFNGDGRVDLAGVNRSMVAVYESLGGGLFEEFPSSFRAGNDPATISAADFDGDGRADLAIGNAGGKDVTVAGNLTLCRRRGARH